MAAAEEEVVVVEVAMAMVAAHADRLLVVSGLVEEAASPAERLVASRPGIR